MNDRRPEGADLDDDEASELLAFVVDGYDTPPPRIVDDVPPMPTDVEARSIELLTFLGVEGELAELLHTSSEQSLAGSMRGDAGRTCSYRLKTTNVTLELELHTDGTVHGYLPPGSGPSVEIVTTRSATTIAVDAFGGFTARVPPSSPFLVKYHGDTAAVSGSDAR